MPPRYERSVNGMWENRVAFNDATWASSNLVAYTVALSNDPSFEFCSARRPLFLAMGQTEVVHLQWQFRYLLQRKDLTTFSLKSLQSGRPLIPWVECSTTHRVQYYIMYSIIYLNIIKDYLWYCCLLFDPKLNDDKYILLDLLQSYKAHPQWKIGYGVFVSINLSFGLAARLYSPVGKTQVAPVG